MEPTISLTGEVVLEKGGPGSGPRPGQRNRQGGTKQEQPSSTKNQKFTEGDKIKISPNDHLFSILGDGIGEVTYAGSAGDISAEFKGYGTVTDNTGNQERFNRSGVPTGQTNFLVKDS